MSATLSRRLGTLLRADAHAVVDSLEERSLLLKQHLREAELELTRKRARADALGEDEKRLATELERARSALERADADAALALDEGDEELARYALRKWIPLRDRVRGLEEELGARREEREALSARIAEQEERFEALRTRVRAELSREPDGAPAAAGAAPPLAVSDEEVELELLRRRGGGTPS